MCLIHVVSFVHLVSFYWYLISTAYQATSIRRCLTTDRRFEIQWSKPALNSCRIADIHSVIWFKSCSRTSRMNASMIQTLIISSSGFWKWNYVLSLNHEKMAMTYDSFYRSFNLSVFHGTACVLTNIEWEWKILGVGRETSGRHPRPWWSMLIHYVEQVILVWDPASRTQGMTL